MPPALTLRYEFARDDDFGWLEATVAAGFGGTSGFWVQWQDVAEWGETLSRYPVAIDAPVEADWGYGEDGEVFSVIRVIVAPANRTGALKVMVTLGDRDDPWPICRTSFLTTYAELARFGEDVRAMMRRERPDAALGYRD